MKVDTSELLTISNFAKRKGISRQHVYRLVKSGEISQVVIDGVKFVHVDKKAQDFQKK